MRLFRRRREQLEKRGTWSLSNGWPVWLDSSFNDDTGQSVTDRQALSVTAVWRAVNLIAGVISTLPLHVYRDAGGVRSRMPSWIDDPAAGRMTKQQWIHTLTLHLLIDGNAFGYQLRGEGGQLMGLQLLPPHLVTVEEDVSSSNGRVYRIDSGGQQQLLGPEQLTHFMGLTLDGIRGIGPLQANRRAVGATLAADKAAARHLSRGMMLGGLVSLDEDMDEEQTEELEREANRKLTGIDNAGSIRFVNASMKFTPWAQNAREGQLLETRGFQVEEVSRIFGVPKVLLSHDGASTWGTGIAELLRAMQRFTLATYTSSIESTLKGTLPKTQFAEFDYKGLLQPSPEVEVESIARQVELGLLTVNEARELLGRTAIQSEATQNVSS